MSLQPLNMLNVVACIAVAVCGWSCLQVVTLSCPHVQPERGKTLSCKCIVLFVSRNLASQYVSIIIISLYVSTHVPLAGVVLHFPGPFFAYKFFVILSVELLVFGYF